MYLKLSVMLAAVLMMAPAVGFRAFAGEGEQQDRVPSLSHSLQGHVNPADLKAIPEAERHNAVMDPNFLDLSGDPNAEVKFPGGKDKFKDLKFD